MVAKMKKRENKIFSLKWFEKSFLGKKYFIPWLIQTFPPSPDFHIEDFSSYIMSNININETMQTVPIGALIRLLLAQFNSL